MVTAFTNVVLSFVGAIFGGDVSFDQLSFTLNGTPIPYGAFLTALVNFLVVGWILFLILTAYNRMRKPAEHCWAPPSSSCSQRSATSFAAAASEIRRRSRPSASRSA